MFFFSLFIQHIDKNRKKKIYRFTPYEWPTPTTCDPNPGTQFTLMNCLWFAIGSLMQQGCDFLPK